MQLPEQTCQLLPFHKSWRFGAWDFGNISDVTPFKLCRAEAVWSTDFCLLPEHWSAGEHFYPNRRLTSLWKLSICFMWKAWTAVQRAFLTGNCWEQECLNQSGSLCFDIFSSVLHVSGLILFFSIFAVLYQLIIIFIRATTRNGNWSVNALSVISLWGCRTMVFAQMHSDLMND